MLSISSPSASLPFVRGATGFQLIFLTVMQSLNVVFDVSLNKLLNKPSYDVTVMDDLALEGASLLSAHYVPVYLKQSCWHKFVDAAKTDIIKELTYQIYVCVYNNCWHNVLFSERYRLEIGGVNPLETCLYSYGCARIFPIYGCIKHIRSSWWKRCYRKAYVRWHRWRRRPYYIVWTSDFFIDKA